MIVTSPSTGFASFQVAHGLGAAPDSVLITMMSGGAIWLDATTSYDATNIYLHASDAGVVAQLTINGAVEANAAGYCSVSDVVADFPSFQRNAPGSVQDTMIQAWITQYAARIDFALLQRGFDPRNPPTPLTVRQATWLQILNADAAIGELGRALQGNVSMQPGEISIMAVRGKNFGAILNDIRAARYDAAFGLQSRLWGSIGGAEIDRSTPGQRGENRAFGRNQEF